MNNFRILIVDDDEYIRNELAEYISSMKILTFKAGTPSEAYEIIETNDIDLVLLDLILPETDGFHVLQTIKQRHPDTEVMIISGHGDMDSSIKAMRMGAIDFFRKPFNPGDIWHAIERTKKYIALTNKLREVESNFELLYKLFITATGQKFIGISPQIKTVLDLMEKVAKTDNTAVFISGESGTGKELVARGIHYMSQRKLFPFCPLNCSSFPNTLFESEFFGHVKGAFTGAASDRQGFLEISNKGTLFLDEISEMQCDLQSKLLRVLEDHKFNRIGSSKMMDVDIRIIASTNQDIHKLIEEKRFRQDLYYRLSAFEIHIPPLRERTEDIPELLHFYIDHFARKLNKKINSVDKNVVTHLMNYAFPGNVRELKNIVEHAIILCDDEVLKLKHFPLRVINNKPGKAESAAISTYDLKMLERNIIMLAMSEARNNKARASKLLKISRQALDRKLEKFGMISGN
jgi:DNA-binding NtrC family response regulator